MKTIFIRKDEYQDSLWKRGQKNGVLNSALIRQMNSSNVVLHGHYGVIRLQLSLSFRSSFAAGCFCCFNSFSFDMANFEQEREKRVNCTLLAEPFLTVHMLCTEKRLCTNPVKFLLSMLSALLSSSFEPRPNRCSFLTVSFGRTFRRQFYLLPAGSVSITGFSQKLVLALEKPVWWE